MSRKGNRYRSKVKREAAGVPQATSDAATLESIPVPRRDRLKQWLFAAALLTAVFVAYRPAWNGGFVWDDAQHVTRPELRSWQGLGRIWFDLDATQQYYPLLHSAFWIEHKLWGDSPLGYHLVNILLHCVAALMVAAILSRLAVPGAYLAAAIFALHPVNVESVAWITELKNTLSAVFYLAAFMMYLRFDQSRSRRLYAAALALFILGLLSKTVTATLPGALLVVFWWQRGRLSWRKDVVPLVPFFVLGAVAGIFTAWVEHTLIGAQGKPFEISLLDRSLLAGRVIWFYLGKLIWPTDLLFIYPRWNLSAAVWWQYVFPAGVVALLTILWFVRRRWRAPLAAVLFFIGTLVPVLGFCNVYPFIFSFVADHFQYLASLGIIALLSAGIALLLARQRLWDKPAGYAVCLALLAPLAILTWRQCAMYTDAETLYRTTIDRNPQCWMAYNNLGVILSDRGKTADAIECFEAALRIKPDHANAHYNLGNALEKIGRPDDALEQYRAALEVRPQYVDAETAYAMTLDAQGKWNAALEHFTRALAIDADNAGAHNALGNALARRDHFDAAEQHFERALQLNPRLTTAYVGLGNVLSNRGRLDDAIEQYQAALAIDPNDVGAHNNLGNTLVKKGQIGEAVRHFTQALQRQPDCVEALGNLGNAQAISGQLSAAIATYRKALAIKPDDAGSHVNLGIALTKEGKSAEAIDHYETALRIRPDLATAHNNLGAALAHRGQIEDALKHFQEAVKLKPDLAEAHHNLGNALVAMGRLDEAASHFRKALELRPQYPEAQEALRATLRSGKISRKRLQPSVQRSTHIPPTFHC